MSLGQSEASMIGDLLASAPERLHEEIGADLNDMIYAATPEEIEARRKAFIRKWRLKHRAVADSLEEAGAFLLRDLLFLEEPPRMRSTSLFCCAICYSGRVRARGCQPGRAAVIVAPHWRHPCAVYQDHAAAIG